jgi:hypothetical protein
MAIPSFFKQTKPRGFNYVPRYYDPQTEEWEKKRTARSMEQGEKSSEQKAWGTEKEKRGEGSSERMAQSEEYSAQSAGNKPYRSKIMRGSMKNYFPRNRERVKKQSMIRFIVILIIIVFVIYIYLRY